MDCFSFLTGTIGGATGIILSHPFDTIKTVYQSGNHKNIIESAKYIYNNSFKENLTKKGIKNFYRGIIPPLIGTGIEKSIVFGVQKNLENKKLSNNIHINNFISGFVAGSVCCAIVTPVEKFKIKIQNGNTFMNLLNELIKLNFKNKVKYLYRGYSATLMRESPGFGIYFTCYNFLKNNTKSMTPLHGLLYGSLTGIISWSFIYPVDPIKTLQQEKNISIIKSINNIYSHYGFKGFYRGFSLSLFRAIPLHSGVFLGVESCYYFKKIE